jgi:hypothetical protein
MFERQELQRLVCTVLYKQYTVTRVYICRGSPFLPDRDNPTLDGRTMPMGRTHTTTERVFRNMRRY